eukprot:768781-Hanusia_phi.AAC.10
MSRAMPGLQSSTQRRSSVSECWTTRSKWQSSRRCRSCDGIERGLILPCQDLEEKRLAKEAKKAAKKEAKKMKKEGKRRVVWCISLSHTFTHTLLCSMIPMMTRTIGRRGRFERKHLRINFPVQKGMRDNGKDDTRPVMAEGQDHATDMATGIGACCVSCLMPLTSSSFPPRRSRSRDASPRSRSLLCPALTHLTPSLRRSRSRDREAPREEQGAREEQGKGREQGAGAEARQRLKASYVVLNHLPAWVWPVEGFARSSGEQEDLRAWRCCRKEEGERTGDGCCEGLTEYNRRSTPWRGGRGSSTTVLRSRKNIMKIGEDWMRRRIGLNASVKAEDDGGGATSAFASDAAGRASARGPSTHQVICE